MKQSKFNPILSPTEKRNLLTQTEFIIDNLDAQGIDQLLSGYSGDEAKLLDLIQEEITNVFSFDEKLSGVALQNMNELSASMDEYLKRFNYNYFKTTMLPNFTQWVFNLEWGNYVQMYPKLGIKASRGLGKTYEFDYALPLWHLYRYRKNSSIRKEPLDIRMSREGVSISNEFSLVKRILRGIREEIENNDLLRDKLFPGKGSGRWGDTEIQTKTGSSWTIRSYGSAIRGLHVGRVIVDDFLDNSCLYSLEQNNKFKEVFNAEIMNILEKAGSIVVVGCVCEKTMILTDKGFRYIGDLCSGDTATKRIELFNTKVLDKNKFVDTSHLYINGETITNKIITDNKYTLECSEIHPLWRMNEDGIPDWCKSNDLKVGDFIAIKHSPSEWEGEDFSLGNFLLIQEENKTHDSTILKLPPQIDDDLCYLIGLYIAEGTMYKNKTGIEISTGDDQIINFLYSLEEKYNIRFRKTNDFAFVCTTKSIWRLWSYLGFTPTKCFAKEIPSKLLSLKKPLLRQVLRGLFDGDGSCSVMKNGVITVSLSSTSEVLMDQVRSILTMGWGLYSYTYKDSVERIRQRSTSSGFNCNYDQLSLNINNREALRFLKEIGFFLDRKQNIVESRCLGFEKTTSIPYQYNLIRRIIKAKKDQGKTFKTKKDRVRCSHINKSKNIKTNKESLREFLEIYSQTGVETIDLQHLRNNLDEDVVWARINSIEKGVSKTVDFVIPETHSFITNGIISHNTPFTQTDLYADLEKDKKWKWFEYPGIMPDGTITNPFRFNYQYYKDLKQQLGTPVFSREILCVPISDQASIFPYSILYKSFIGMENICLAERIEEYPITFKKVVCGLDYALSGSVGADFSVFTVVGLDSLDQYHVVYQYRKQGASHFEQVAEMQRIKINFHPDLFYSEANNFQRVMIDLAKEAGINNIEPFITTGFNKRDLRSGLPSLAALFEQGRIKLPRGDEKSKAITDVICQEFNSISYDPDKNKLESSSGHDDTTMSLFISIKGMNAVNSQLNINYL